jgi:hypothetical protein
MSSWGYEWVKEGEDKRFGHTKSVICLFLSNSVLIHEIVSFRVAESMMTARVNDFRKGKKKLKRMTSRGTNSGTIER